MIQGVVTKWSFETSSIQTGIVGITSVLPFQKQFHPLTEAFTDVRFQKKQFSFVSTNPAPHWFACHPESSLLNPHPCIVSSASFGHSTAPSRKREDIILLLNKVLGDEARCSFFLNTVRGNDGSMFPVKSTPSRFKCLLSQCTSEGKRVSTRSKNWLNGEIQYIIG